MAQSNAELESWPPESLLVTAQEAVWSDYVGGIVRPCIAIWDNMTTYLQEQPPESFMLYHSDPSIKTRWGVRQIARHEPTGRTMTISAAIETGTPLSGLRGAPGADEALERLAQLGRDPDPAWPMYHRKPSIPARALLEDHPAFILDVARARNILDVRMHTNAVTGGDKELELLRGVVTKEYRVRIAPVAHELDTHISEKSPSLFRPRHGLGRLRKEVVERTGDQLALAPNDEVVTRTIAEQVLRDSLPRYIGTGFKELEQIHLALIGQIGENPRL